MNILHAMTESEYEEYLKMRTNMRNLHFELVPKEILNLTMNISNQTQ